MTHFKGVIIIDDDDNAADVDQKGSALVIIELEHRRIHQGVHFYFHDVQTIANGNNIDYMLTTPDDASRIHMNFDVNFTAVTQIELFEDGDRNGTAGQTVFNNDRNSATAAVLTIDIGTGGGTTDGSPISPFSGGIAAGAQARAGGASKRSNELILAQNTKYILRVSSSTNGNLCTTDFEWYEASVPTPPA